MKNFEIHKYSEKPVCDSHCHATYPHVVDETVYILKTTMDYFNYEKVCVQSLPSYNVTDTYKNFYYKAKLMPNVYMGAGINHNFDQRDTADFYLGEIKKYHAMGCDGIKMLEGKMELFRKLMKPLGDAVYDKFFAYAEENHIPIVMHVGDPIEYWDYESASDYVKMMGWVCGPEDPTLEDLRAEISKILEKFPNLTLILAHFYFMYDDLDRVAAMFEKYPNLHFDLTPGGDMFLAFDKKYDEARSFFEKYADRILYGTDTYNWAFDETDPETRQGNRINLVRTYLEGSEDFKWYGTGPVIRPFNFKDDILDKIYRKNFVKIYGKAPRALNHALIAEDCKKFIDDMSLDELTRVNIKTVFDYFKKG